MIFNKENYVSKEKYMFLNVLICALQVTPCAALMKTRSVASYFYNIFFHVHV